MKPPLAAGTRPTKPNPTMSYNNRRKPRTYTYRVDIEDSKALRKINYLDALSDDYWITKLHSNNVPTAGNGRHFGFVFYQSKEHFDYDRNEMVGGTIPGLAEYRYSLEWETLEDPDRIHGRLEMKNASRGGTRIRGERHVGFSDPRLSDYVPIDTVVPFTPTEIKAMLDGEPVPDKVNFSHDPPEIPASEARDLFREELKAAERVGIERVYEALEEYIEDCDHKHVVTTGREHSEVAFCEDCDRDWDAPEFDYDRENDDLRVVGSC